MDPLAPFDLAAELALFLATCRTASLATVDDHGRPHAANIQYAHDPRHCLYFVSSPESDHSRHIARRPDIALTIYAHNDKPESIHGLQLHGRCQAIEDDPARWNQVWEIYTAKFSFIRSLPQMRKMIEAQRFYCVHPTWMRWIDNRRGFGWKFETTIPHDR